MVKDKHALKYKKWPAVILILAVFAVFGKTFAESPSINQIYLEGPVSVMAPGSEFAVSVYAQTKSPINAFEVELEYPRENLRFLNYDNAGSIADIWQTEPSPAKDGKIKMTGGIIGAFRGEEGLVAKLHFRAVKSGLARFSVVKKNFYLADGRGTEVEAATNNFSVNIAGGASVPFLFLPPPPKDNTPPNLYLEVVKNPPGSPPLVTFYAADKESGIKNTEMRFKNWLNFTEWQKVKSPALYPSGAWYLEIKATNGAGKETTENFLSIENLTLKIAKVFFASTILAVLVNALYNKFRRKK